VYFPKGLQFNFSSNEKTHINFQPIYTRREKSTKKFLKDYNFKTNFFHVLNAFV